MGTPLPPSLQHLLPSAPPAADGTAQSPPLITNPVGGSQTFRSLLAPLGRTEPQDLTDRLLYGAGGGVASLPLMAATGGVAPTLSGVGRAAIGAGVSGAGAEAGREAFPDYPLLGSIAGSMAPSAALKIGSSVGGAIVPKLSEDAQTLRAAGVQPTPGSAVGGFPGAAENVLSTIPVIGAPIKAARAEAQTQLDIALAKQKDSFVRGAVNEPLAKISESLNADTAPGHDAIAEMQQKLSNAYSQAVPTAGGALDAQASRTLGDSVANAKLNLPDSQAKQFENFVQTNILGKVQGTTQADATSALTTATTTRQKAASDLSAAQNNAMQMPGPGSDINVANATNRLVQANAAESRAQQQLAQAQTGAPFGTLSGQDFQDLDRQLGKEAHSYLKSLDPDQQKLGDAYLNLQGQMRDWLERVSPQNAADLQAANQAWRMAKPVEGAARRTNDPNGIFTDRDLQIASRASSTTPQFAAGGALMQQFAGNAMMQRNALEDAGKTLKGPSALHGVGAGVLGAALLEHGSDILAHPYAAAATLGLYPAMRAAYSPLGRPVLTGLLGAVGRVPPAIGSMAPNVPQQFGGLVSGLLTP
jgi:hypothetical protein